MRNRRNNRDEEEATNRREQERQFEEIRRKTQEFNMIYINNELVWDLRWCFITYKLLCLAFLEVSGVITLACKFAFGMVDCFTTFGIKGTQVFYKEALTTDSEVQQFILKSANADNSSNSLGLRENCLKTLLEIWLIPYIFALNWENYVTPLIVKLSNNNSFKEEYSEGEDSEEEDSEGENSEDEE
tara:strand:- start:39 stop:596 length:558 start_codon:yes stop_codon:yes gene_type:complete